MRSDKSLGNSQKVISDFSNQTFVRRAGRDDVSQGLLMPQSGEFSFYDVVTRRGCAKHLSFCVSVIIR